MARRPASATHAREPSRAPVLAAALLGLLNSFVRPLLLFFTLPLNIVTLGLFTFLLNALILLTASGLVRGFSVSGLGVALVGAILIRLSTRLITYLLKPVTGVECGFG